jgi:hypothetical protein
MAKINHIKNGPLGPITPAEISTRQALGAARLAIGHLLWGDPPIETFDVRDLEAALVVLGQMSETLEPMPLLKIQGGG